MRRAVPASFLEPMLCLATAKLPQGEEWQYELFLRIRADSTKSLRIHVNSMGGCPIEGLRLVDQHRFVWLAPGLNAERAQRLHRHPEF
jgi:hypothetical protein